MAQVKIINNTNQRIELMLQDPVSRVMKGSALQPRGVKIVEATEVTPQTKMLANKKFITIIELG